MKQFDITIELKEQYKSELDFSKDDILNFIDDIFIEKYKGRIRVSYSKSVNWTNCNERIISDDFIAVARSKTNGIGLARYKYSPSNSQRWTWLYKRIDGSKVIEDVIEYLPIPD